MRRLLVVMLLFFSISGLFAQSLELYGGVSRNRFYDFQKDEDYFSSDYTPGWGYTFGVAYEYTGLPKLTLRFVLNFESYNGETYTTNGGLGGYASTKASVKENCIGIDIYPINIKIIENLKINIGGAFKFLVSENISGDYNWASGPSSGGGSLNEESEQISSSFNFGIITLISYRIKFSEGWYIVPQYQFYWGLTNEFINGQANTKSLRNYLLVGISKDLK